MGQKYETDDSDFRLEKMTHPLALDELEARLLDEETKKLVVRYQICSYCSFLLKSAINAILPPALRVNYNY